MKMDRHWIARVATTLFAVALLYPFTALFAHIGPWQWGDDIRGAALSSMRVSLLLTSYSMLVIVAIGTPVAAYIAHCKMRERLLWQAVLLIPILLPPLALGILLSLAFGSIWNCRCIFAGFRYRDDQQRYGICLHSGLCRHGLLRAWSSGCL